jgi:hypothetical protein
MKRRLLTQHRQDDRRRRFKCIIVCICNLYSDVVLSSLYNASFQEDAFYYRTSCILKFISILLAYFPNFETKNSGEN